MKPVELHRVTVRHGGRECNGNWEVEDGRLVVSSAYGSRAERAGDPETLADRARVLLTAILEGRP